MSIWRKRASEAIATVRTAHPDAHGAELRALLRSAYPFGERRYYPYKIWLDCVNAVCGRRTVADESLPLFADISQEITP